MTLLDRLSATMADAEPEPAGSLLDDLLTEVLVPPVRVPLAAPPFPEPEGLPGRERAAVLMSLRDGRASATGSRWRTAVARIVFGLRQPTSFVDSRLEALRRYAILYRLDGAGLSFDEDERLRAAGFSSRQAAAARAVVDAHYLPERDRPRGRWALAATAGLAVVGAALLYRWFAAQVDDPASALVVTFLMTTGAVSIAAVTSHPHSRRL